MPRHSLYFTLKPLLPDRLRTRLRTWFARRSLQRCPATWPIDESAGRTPVGWQGWPGGKQFAIILTHDVESIHGARNCMGLADVEEKHGFRSSFNLVPEGSYVTPPELRANLTGRGFEIGVHDLHHDGKLLRSRDHFRRNAARINLHLREWGAKGFRAAYMLHQLDWFHDLNVEYDASTFDTDPIEPQSDAASTIFPFWVPAPVSRTPVNRTEPADRRGSVPPSDPTPKGFLELPYTLPQDSTLFLFLGHSDINLWKRKVEWIANRGGMVLLNLHPDYLAFGKSRGVRKDYPAQLYESFLQHLREKYAGAYWHALPRELTQHVRKMYPEGGPRRPRHACMLSYSFFEQDNRVQRYARALASRGDSVDILTLRAKSDTVPDRPRTASLDGVEFEPGIRVHHLQDRARDEKRIVDYIRRMLAFLLRASQLLARLDRLRNFDVIHVHNIPDFLVFAAWQTKRRGSRVILDLHDLLPEFYASKFLKAGKQSPVSKALLLCERWSCTFADHVIISNHLWRDKVAQRTGLQNRCTAIVNHVDVEPYRKWTRQHHADGNPDRAYIAAFPGGFYHHQGLHIAIEALPKVRVRFPNAKIHLVGDGPEREHLQSMVKELNLGEAVTISPPIPISKVPEFLAKADIGIVPKLAVGFGNEAYSTKIMEFMAAGIPVLASRTRIDEYYFGQGEVHFFKSGNADDMALRWVELLEDQDLRKSLVEKGLAYADAHGWEKHAADYLQLFDRLAQQD
jgi:glycosyltransferase involved in cell wall biosynthesis/peptidoglycan/xylan/chitin deacetylase (PgdA/CDA1 family)